ncbi:MAG: hypothetical protein EOO28_28340 [Comamonadaceae bacterium]|nr:MAG: hypothetical protein EOO28_28340 [Comamonadaceae bacterium]
MSTKKSSFNTSRACAWLLGLSVLLAAGCGGGGDTPPPAVTPPTPVAPAPETPVPEVPTPEIPATVRVAVLSSQAHMVSGPDALLEVEVLDAANTATVSITSNGTDVTAAFTPDASTGKLVGKITNVQVGANEVRVRLGDYTARLALTGYPVAGPIISGPQEKPFICTTNFAMPTGTPALTLIPGDPNCGVVTQVDYVYRTTGGAFTAMPSLTAYPANMGTTTVAGVTVPYILRVETGTINRAIYQTALLHDVVNEPAPGPGSRPAGWNGKLIYTLGGGCQGGWFMQGASTGGVVNHTYLAKGYAVASSTLNVMGNNCNDLLSSETIIMVKERFIKNYGVPVYTVGTGGSGGAYQSNQTGDNFPGTFDGIIISQVFADVNSSTLFKQFDSRLLNNYLAANVSLSTEKRQAIGGYLQVGNISNMSGQAGRIDPTVSFPAGVNAGVGPNFRYNATTNRGGARASVYDHTRNVYGVNAEGHAARPIDNVGIQYGLQALNAGKISVAEFLDLNQKIGGLDLDLKPTAARTVGDAAVLARAYQSGRILWGGGGLASMPIIDNRDYNDGTVGGDIHTKIHSFSVRERLRNANGHADNHVIWVLRPDATNESLAAMDAWLMAVRADTSSSTLAQKVVANRPVAVKDACWKSGIKYEEEQTAAGTGTCNSAGFYPAGTTPRMAAGGPLADDIAKCQLKPLDPADYAFAFNPLQWLLLQNVFPDGVCDWSKPGVGQQASRPWQSFGPSPVNLLFDITKP